MWVIKAGGVDHRRCQVQNRDLQQLVDEGLLVHHVCHIWHIELMKLWAVLQHNVSNLSDQHALSQSHFQIHEKPGRRRRSSVLTSTQSVGKKIYIYILEVLYVELSLFTGCHDATNVGKQNVMLHFRKGPFQWRRCMKMTDSNSKAPQVRRLRTDQLEHRLQMSKIRVSKTITFPPFGLCLFRLI